MKQVIFMFAVTTFGALGAFIRPVYGVYVYYLYAIVRPQFLWWWVLSDYLRAVRWSFIVAIPTLLVAAGTFLGMYSERRGSERRQQNILIGPSHIAVLLFGFWVCISYLAARDQDYAHVWFIEYIKIMAMFGASAILLRSLDQLWVLLLIAGGGLGYVAYDVNVLYLQHRTIFIYDHGYCGLDNNGAGLMLAMGVPLCLYTWEGSSRWYRWVAVAFVPVLVHAVLMSYSRGAMVALLAASPWFLARSRFRRYTVLCFLGMALLVPLLAGKEIRDRFFSIEQFEKDQSAQSRFLSWRAGWEMALDHPFLGVGLRNSPLYVVEYGADVHQRTIHSQYIQIAADTGLVGLGLYFIALYLVWRDLATVRRMVGKKTDEESLRVIATVNAVECSMAVFCIGAVFLSLELFELPYLLLLLGAQARMILQSRQLRATGDPLTATVHGAYGSRFSYV